MSKLEFVAIQFGVKFTIIFDLRQYADRVCQRYLQCFIYFENFVFSSNYLIVLPSFYHFTFYYFILFSFKVVLLYSLYGLTALDRHIVNEENFLRFHQPK